MDFNDFASHYHNLKFQLICHERKAAAFQSFFEKIMQKHDPTFISVKPSGREGDWKCDGFSQGSGTVYQCYAPEEMTDKKTVDKIKTDFEGAKTKWGSQMKSWVFVWSAHEALSPLIIAALHQLISDNSNIAVDNWNREALWKIAEKLPHGDRVELLGIVPEIQAATETTAAEIQTLLNYLIKLNIPLAPDNLELTELAEKIKKNKLGEAATAIIRISLPIAREVESYTQKHPDIHYSENVSAQLAEKYKSLANAIDVDPDVIFGGLVEYVSNQQLNQPKYYWAAAGIVAHYFQLCDLFER